MQTYFFKHWEKGKYSRQNDGTSFSTIISPVNSWKAFSKRESRGKPINIPSICMQVIACERESWNDNILSISVVYASPNDWEGDANGLSLIPLRGSVRSMKDQKSEKDEANIEEQIRVCWVRSRNMELAQHWHWNFTWKYLDNSFHKKQKHRNLVYCDSFQIYLYFWIKLLVIFLISFTTILSCLYLLKDLGLFRR